MQEGKKDETESFLRQTKKDLSDNPEGYRMLGDFYYADGDLDKATAEYASLHNDHPKDIRVKKNYIQLLDSEEPPRRSHQADNEILKANPHDVDGLSSRPRCNSLSMTPLAPWNLCKKLYATIPTTPSLTTIWDSPCHSKTMRRAQSPNGRTRFAFVPI